MKIATWNVNSIRARQDAVLQWLQEAAPDVLCLQETKVPDEAFPGLELSARGYRAEISGQRAYNGVAIISREPATDVVRELPGTENDHRFLAATVSGVRVLCAYIPNGGQVGSDKHAYKLRWFEALHTFLKRNHDPNEMLLLCGDFNVATEERDVYDPLILGGDVCYHESVRAALAPIAEWGLVDAYRLHDDNDGRYTWWDYRARGFERNRGMRIDHIWVTRPLAERCTAATIDFEPRKRDKPSDHAPVLIELDG